MSKFPFPYEVRHTAALVLLGRGNKEGRKKKKEKREKKEEKQKENMKMMGAKQSWFFGLVTRVQCAVCSHVQFHDP